MSDHAIIVLTAIVGFAVQLTGLVILGLMARQSHRESQRLTRAVAGLVYQESDKIRRLFGDEK